MNWITIIVVIAALAALFIFKQMSLISPKDAKKHLQDGALVIDVRSPGEYSSGHLSKAINIPLGELETRLPEVEKDKSRVMLLHCLSGGRSSAAVYKLKAMGYQNVFNLGGYGRAQSIAHESPAN